MSLSFFLSFFSVDKIIAFLAEKTQQVGALFILKFNELRQDNKDLAQLLKDQQAEFDKVHEKDGQPMRGVDRAEMVVNAVLVALKQEGNDALRAFLFALNGVIFYEDHYGPKA